MLIEHPFYPIVFVRGYAGSQHAIEEAVGDPYMGLNLGSTRLRQLWTGDVVQHFFESPLVRLMKEYNYRDVFESGAAISPSRRIPSRSVIIHRYYDAVSSDFGWDSDGEIETYAAELAKLVLTVQDRVCGSDKAARSAFKVYLVAHSMGGLICRAFLQNQALGGGSPEIDAARKMVDKVFTYATPHNGIELRLVGNVPGFLSANHADNFNRLRMCRYLGLPPESQRDVATLNGKFDPDRFFCLIGTNDRDYEVAMGLSRKAVGPMSDGLVRIANASVRGVWPPGQSEKEAPRAFVHRSHSGPYGIVNSEEGYQNLRRFLFGDVRVDARLQVDEITLPPEVEKRKAHGKDVRASYHFEAVVAVRGAQWHLHRRLVSEGSAVFATYEELFPKDESVQPRRPHLFSAFLSSGARVNMRRESLGFSVDLRVLVPQYEVDGRLLFDHHYEGGSLFRDKLNLEALPPEVQGGPWRMRFGFDSQTPNRASTVAEGAMTEDTMEFRVPVSQATRPGIRAQMILTVRPWNNE